MRDDAEVGHPRLPTERHLAATRAVGETIWDLADGHLGEHVPACPEWRVRELVHHLGNVAFFVRACLDQGAGEPEFTDAELPGDAEVIDWAAGEWKRTLDQLAAADPDTPAWNWSREPRVASFWPRCLTHEAFVHGWDLATAVGGVVDIPPDVAADGVDEILAVHLPAGVAGGRRFPVAGRIEVASTDTGHHWVVRTTADSVLVSVTGDRAEERFAATAADLYLDLWGRKSLDLAPARRAWLDQLAANWSAG